ncbi:LysE family translocator [Halomonas sp. V046]|uniref:LysE family translocator n=1 Tax=Halomonas sp. V046 TaxID=3459611 RepID=UPI004044862C
MTMSLSLLLSMSAFAVAASISPGPVNLLVLSTAMRVGWRRSLPLVLGASAGFTVLLWLIGLGMIELWERVPLLRQVVRLGGVAFLVWLAWRLACSDGELDIETSSEPAGAGTGALMQWLNPKAWLASAAGMGAFVADGNLVLVTAFALLWGSLCALSIGLWALAGSRLSQWVSSPRRMQGMNRALAGLLALSAGILLLG